MVVLTDTKLGLLSGMAHCTHWSVPEDVEVSAATEVQPSAMSTAAPASTTP